MRYLFIILSTIGVLSLSSCDKEEQVSLLPPNRLEIVTPNAKDTIVTPLSILENSTLSIPLQAKLLGTASNSDHVIRFRAAPEKLIDFRARYGEAELLPATNYLFYKADAHLPAGATLTEQAVLNVAQQMQLLEYTTYVLPIAIEKVDGDVDAADAEQVVYYVFKTGKPLVINKTGWAIANATSQFNNFTPNNLIDTNPSTYWASNIVQSMPQSVTINFNRNVTFTGVSYSLPSILSYPNLGGYPTNIRIETSMNGVDWSNHGEFAGAILNNTQQLSIGLTTARYLRFTALASVKYANTYDAVFISDISLIP